MIDRTTDKLFYPFWVAVSFLLVSDSYAQTTSDVQQMLINLSRAYEPVWLMITGIMYILGITLTFRALYHLKVYGELRTMMASNASMKEPVTYLITAAVLLYFPTALGIFMETTFGYTNILAYSDWQGAGGGANEPMDAIIKLVQIVGLISFARGWLIITKAVHPGSQATYGKGMTHIIAGVLAINIVGTANIISNTFDISL